MGWTYRKASICVSRKSWKPSRNLAEKANKLIGRVSRRLFRAHHCAESTMTLCSAASHCVSCWGVTCLCNSRSHLRHTKCMRVRRISVLAVLPLVNPDVCGSQCILHPSAPMHGPINFEDRVLASKSHSSKSYGKNATIEKRALLTSLTPVLRPR
jgi:hypothetical protein